MISVQGQFGINMTAQQQPAVNAGSELYNMQMNKSQQKSVIVFQTPEIKSPTPILSFSPQADAVLS
jgi:hypothetical protein